MRVLWATTVLVVLALVGYTSRPSAQTEATHAAIMPGEKVILVFDVHRSDVAFCPVMRVA